jgi:hypothetical protein
VWSIPALNLDINAWSQVDVLITCKFLLGHPLYFIAHLAYLLDMLLDLLYECLGIIIVFEELVWLYFLSLIQINVLIVVI